MSGEFGQVPLRGLGSYFAKNFKFGNIPSYAGRAVQAYRARYITCKNPRMTPFWHCVGACILLNYMIDYKHLKKERLRKHH